jgi:heat shock protein HslJ
MRPGATLMGIALAIAVAGCGSHTRSGSAAASPGDPNGSWVLVSGTDAGRPLAVLRTHPITLILRGSEITGIAACNGYGSRLTAIAGGVRIDPPAQELVGCADDVQAAVRSYLEALPRVTSLSMDGDTLVLGGPATELRFERLPSPPVADIVGTSWVLETLFVGDVAAPAAGHPATLELREDGTLAGSTGCRAFAGTWVEAGNQIVATTLEMDASVCAPALQQQDGHVVGVIGDGFVPTVDRELLTLTDPGGVGLVYRLAG